MEAETVGHIWPDRRLIAQKGPLKIETVPAIQVRLFRQLEEENDSC